MHIKRFSKSAMWLVYAAFVWGCDGKPPVEKVPVSTHAAQDVNAKLAIQRGAEVVAEKPIDLFASASDAELMAMLAQCKEAVWLHAQKLNKGPFEIALIDESSADIYSYAAGSSATQSFDRRVQAYRKYGHETGYVNTEFAVLSAYDSFSGPQKAVTKYYCRMQAGLKIASIEKRL